MSDKLRAARQAVLDAVGNVPKGSAGRATCPSCGTHLYWSRSRSGRTIWMNCETHGCVYYHAQTAPEHAWPGVNGLEVKGNA